MPIYTVPSPPSLFRGHFFPQKAGDVLCPAESTTCYGDKGSFVFASSLLSQAAAYGFKAAQASRIGYFNLAGEIITNVILLVDKKDFQDLLQAKTYLQELDPQNFKGVFANESCLSSLPAEWVSEKPERVRDVKVLSNEDVLKAGVQVFTTENLSVFQQRGLGLAALKEMVSSGQVVWENMKPDYDDVPLARSETFIDKLGFTAAPALRPRSFMQNRPRTSNNYTRG